MQKKGRDFNKNSAIKSKVHRRKFKNMYRERQR